MNQYSTKLSTAVIILAFALLPSLVLAQMATSDSTLHLPRRQSHLVVDGDLSDWKGPCLKVDFSESDIPEPLNNSGVFQLVWDSDFLWFAITIEDSEVFFPPKTVTGSAVYQWDSIEIYIDGHGNRSSRMDENDTQLIVSCSGRNGAMHGDEMLHNVENWLVPKRKHRGLAVQTAARTTPSGYIVEGAFPWSAVDVVNPREGKIVALDLAWNDWIEDHPRLPELQEDLENLAAIFNNETQLGLVDPDSLGWTGLGEWEKRAYRPRAWKTGTSFGIPTQWQLVQLVGQQPMTEALVDQFGLVPLLVATFLVLLMISLIVDFRLRRQYRARVRDLLIRIEDLTILPEPQVSDPSHWKNCLDGKLDNAPDSGENMCSIFVQIRLGISENLSVGDLASRLGISTRTLQRVCKDELGATPRDIIQAVKMRAAHDALISGKWRVGEVASQVGFDSPYHFSRRFKDYYKEPPSSFIPPRSG